MKKKIIDGSISLTMIIMAIVIAGGILLFFIEPSETERNRNKTKVDWSNVTDDETKELEISIQGMPITGGSAGSWIQRNLEKRFNIKLKPYFFDWNGFRQKRPLILASGEIPDVMWDGDPINVRNNIRNNFTMEVPYEIILKYAPNYVKMLNRAGKEGWMYAWYDGKNYGLPTFNDQIRGPRFGAWRKDWLDNVGISKTPDTIEEMENVLYHFRNSDPDKNGKKDTYGYAPNISHWSLAYTDVFAAFDLLPFDFMRIDGKIVWGGIQPECKDVLALLKSWYEKDLIDPDFIIDTQGIEQRTKFLNNKLGYLFTAETSSDYDTELEGTTANVLKELSNGTMVVARPLKNSNGIRRGRSWGGAAHVMQFGAHLGNNPEKIIRYLKMIDAICMDELLYVETRSGEKDKYWSYNEEKGIYIKDEYKDNPILTKEMIGDRGFTCPIFFQSNLFTNYNLKYSSKYEKEFFKKYQRSEWAMINALGKSDILPSASRYLENLRILQQQVYAKIIIGELPLSAFDDFVKEWHERGGDILTAEANEMYQIIQDVYKKVGVTK